MGKTENVAKQLTNNIRTTRSYTRILKKTREKQIKNSFCYDMANMKLVFLFSVVIAIGLSSGFELGKNQKKKSVLKQKLESMIVEAKSAKQFELKRQDAPINEGPRRTPRPRPRPPPLDPIHEEPDDMGRSARDIPPKIHPWPWHEPVA